MPVSVGPAVGTGPASGKVPGAVTTGKVVAVGGGGVPRAGSVQPVTNREITRSRAKRTILFFMIFSF